MKFDHSDFLDIISRNRKGLRATTLRGLLFCLSSVYRVVIRIRNQAFDRRWRPAHVIDAAVISVGNLTAGGTGKTPFVIWLAEQLRQTHDVAIVSRGYGGGAEPGRLNDEGREIEQRLPSVVQIQDPDRVAAAREAVERLRQNASDVGRSPVILLDDGFQHRRLARDLDIVLVDATCPFGFGYLLPRGLLREPIDALQRAKLAVLTRANLVEPSRRAWIREQLRAHNPDLKMAEAELEMEQWLSADGVTLPIQALQGQRLFAFCGIGNPRGFLETARSAGMNVVDHRPFADHHGFQPQEIRALGELARQKQCQAIVCTHKDLVKLDRPDTGGTPIFALMTRLRIRHGEPDITELIGRTLTEWEQSGRYKTAEAQPHG